MKWLKRIGIGCVLLVILASLGWLALGLWPDPMAEDGGWDWTVQVTDRQGRLLKEFLPPRTARREARPLAGFSPNLTAAVLAAEDRRFFYHPGVDPLAMLRALKLNIASGRIKSGGSTITMQLARLNRGLTPGPRTMDRKLREIWWALLIERHNDKETILAEYLNRAPCGNLTEGFPAAARQYLNKSVADLSPAEAAFLAGLPASPGALNPYKDPRPALTRRTVVLERMLRAEMITAEQFERAGTEPLALTRSAAPFDAPHFVSYIRRHFDQASAWPPPVVTTTLDLNLQQKIEELVEETAVVYRPQGLSQAAVVVMNQKREVLAWVGSADFFDSTTGQNDGVTALRQPGSALKPFIYAVALDEGFITAATLLDDRAVDYRALSGSFSPTNYSGDFHGPVPARLALASSLNLPAVKLAEKVGLGRLLACLRELGLESLSHEADYYGLGLALGGGEVNLLSLTTAYAALADSGRWRPAITRLEKNPSPGQNGANEKRVFSPGASFIITDILADPRARITGFGSGNILSTPYPAAVKTGTSKNFRDNWCLGYTGSFVVGVWAGNFEADPMNNISGVTGAGNIWRRVSDLLAKEFTTPDFQRPKDVHTAAVCPLSGLLAGPECPHRRLEFFLAGREPEAQCVHSQLNRDTLGVTVPVVGLRRNFGIIRPLSGETYAIDPGINPSVQNIRAQAQSVPEVDEMVWRLNGREIARQRVEGYARQGCEVPLARGQARLEVLGLRQGEIVHQSQVNYLIK